MQPLNLLVADDHPMFRAALLHGLAEVLEGGSVVEVASQSALERAVVEQPTTDLVLLDLTMPGAMGFSSLVWLRSQRPDWPVIVISSNDHPRTVRRAQQFGAAGFVPKSAPAVELRRAVGKVMEGGNWFPAEKAERSQADAELASRLAQLTPQQMKVLMLLADGLLNKQIAHELSLAENTVKIHVAAVLQKLKCHSRTQAAVLLKSLEQQDLRPDE